jgi:coiled-coil domain-containing protein 130
MGRYVPPDLEGVVSANRASGKGHALGARARKLKTEGILTVRFECPFAIWCTTCSPEQIIGQGVRFNAEKKKVGNYFSTPVWGFRFKHVVCGGWIEVRTDPKNAEYVVTEGGRRRDLGLEKVLDGEIRIGATDEEKDRLEKDGGFGALEKKVADKTAADTQKVRMQELQNISERNWSDPYEMSKKLRRQFRVGRRKRQADEKSAEALQEKFGLSVEMLAEDGEDGARARLVDFGEQKEVISSSKPLFSHDLNGAAPPNATSKPGKVSGKADRRELLSNTLRDNTRAAADPFLHDDDSWRPRAKRKRDEEVAGTGEKAQPPKVESSISTALVAYDSDSA